MTGSESKAPERKELLQRALLRIESLETRLAEAEKVRHEPIAIVGIGCRFPGGANSPDAFWELLRDGVDAVTDVPADRWRAEDYLDPDPNAVGKAYVMQGGFLDDVESFDAPFFGIAPREAEQMDPQQRLLLEVAWEALEDAGIAPDTLAGSPTGAFVGMTASDFLFINTGTDPEGIDTYLASGTSHAIAAGRLSYVLGLKGPAITVDTACSSALMAVHLACHSLRVGECRAALAGGVLIMLSPDGFVAGCKGRMLSPSGRCKTFDRSADGYVRAEGCAMVALKTLSDAEADGDHILAVIRGSAANQDGRSSGLTAPSGQAQEEVIREALKHAGAAPSEVVYVETHGTGTSLGDPIEIQALGTVYSEGRDAAKPLMIGSVKTNIGHTEGLAGVAGLIKVVLSLTHGRIPPHLHLRDPNPHIPWSDYPLRVTTELSDWPTWATRRIVGLSSFGFSGTNVHMIVEEAPTSAPPPPEVERPLHVMTLSGRREAAPRELAAAYRERVLDQDSMSVGDLCFTSNVGRAHLEHRVAVLADSREDLARGLESCAVGRSDPHVYRGSAPPNREPKVGFLFTGQGSQYVGMGRDLYDTQPTFRRALERCDAALRGRLEHPLLSVLYPTAGKEQEARALLNQTAYTQPALFSLEWALAELWQSWGVVPSVVTGHSVGEFAAACVAGALTVEDGLRLIAERGRLMQALPAGGAMSAIFAGESVVRDAVARFEATVSIGAVNGPDNIVVAGAAADVHAIARRFESEGVQSKELTVSHAFHSPLMRPVVSSFFEVAKKVAHSTPQIDFVSTVTGSVESAPGAVGPEYWRDQILREVRFADAMLTLRDQGCHAFLEIGPGTTLLGMGRRCLPQSKADWLPSLRPDQSGWKEMLGSLATLYVRGLDVDWEGFDRDYGHRRVSLPTYHFEPHRYPVYRAKPRRHSGLDPLLHPLLGRKLESPAIKDWIWQSTLEAEATPASSAYSIYGTVTVPAASLLEAALSASQVLESASCWSVQNLLIGEAITADEQRATTLQTVLSRDTSEVVWYSRVERSDEASAPWTQGARCKLAAEGPPDARTVDEAALEAYDTRCREEIGGAELYDLLEEVGLRAGSTFRAVESLRRRDGEVVGRLRIGEAPDDGRVRFAPGLVEASLQLLLAALPGLPAFFPGAPVYGTTSIGRFRLLGTLPTTLNAHGEIHADRSRPHRFVGAVTMYDDDGNVLAELSDVVIEPLSLPRWQRSRLERWMYDVSWVSQPLPPADETTPVPARRWVILADDGGVGDTLARLLGESGNSAIMVRSGERFATLESGDAVVDPTREEDLAQLLLRVCSADGGPPECSLVSLWDLDSGLPDDPAGIQEAVGTSCSRLLSLAQAVGRSETVPKPSVTIVTRGAQPVAGHAGPQGLVQASLWGMARVLRNEHPEIPSRIVDLDPAPDVERDARALADELLPGAFAEGQVAFRNGERFVARLHRHASPDAGPSTRLDLSAGAYLVTGGLGGLGLTIAELLADRGARRLYLMGRSGASDAAKAIIAELSARGTEVVVLQADVSDLDQVSRALSRLDEDGVPLKGVVHSAGVIDDGLMLHQSPDRFAPVLAPKVAGSWVLHTLTLDRDLDFFVLFSSASTLFGQPGQGNYAAANAFLDLLAHQRRALGLPALSINWGAWGQVGMAAAMDDSAHARWATLGVGEIAPRDGAEAMELAMGTSAEQLGVVPIDWRRWKQAYRGAAIPTFVADLVRESMGEAGEGPGPSSTELRARLASGAEAREGILTDFVTRHVAALLGLSASTIDVEVSVADLGFDSLMAMELKNRIELDLGMTVPVGALLDGPSVVGVADRLLRELETVGVGGPITGAGPNASGWEEGEL